MKHLNPLLEIAIQCHASAWEKYELFIQERCEKILQDILQYEKCQKNVELSILLTHNEEIQSLNRDYRQKDAPTNVLSFPSDDDMDCPYPFFPLGDLVLAYEYTYDESLRENKSFEDHVTHLLAHGLLHLFGYDHSNDEEALHMENRETMILQKFSIKNPYTLTINEL
jgi:probable rRNA maturation factor